MNTAIEDAEVVSEGPKPPPPPPRVAELKPAPAGEAFSVFDGPVDDAKNAKRKPKEGAPRPRPAANGKGKGGKRPQTPPAAAAGPTSPPGPDPEFLRRLQANAEARELLELYEQWQLGMVRGRYTAILDPTNLAQLLQALKYHPEQLQRMSTTLGRGFYENEVEIPWWASFGALFVADVLAKKKMLEGIELAYQAHLKKQQQQSEAAAAAPAKAA